jgi:hypothetical protein
VCARHIHSLVPHECAYTVQSSYPLFAILLTTGHLWLVCTSMRRGSLLPSTSTWHLLHAFKILFCTKSPTLARFSPAPTTLSHILRLYLGGAWVESRERAHGARSRFPEPWSNSIFFEHTLTIPCYLTFTRDSCVVVHETTFRGSDGAHLGVPGWTLRVGA